MGFLGITMRAEVIRFVQGVESSPLDLLLTNQRLSLRRTSNWKKEERSRHAFRSMRLQKLGEVKNSLVSPH